MLPGPAETRALSAPCLSLFVSPLLLPTLPALTHTTRYQWRPAPCRQLAPSCVFKLAPSYGLPYPCSSHPSQPLPLLLATLPDAHSCCQVSAEASALSARDVLEAAEGLMASDPEGLLQRVVGHVQKILDVPDLGVRRRQPAIYIYDIVCLLWEFGSSSCPPFPPPQSPLPQGVIPPRNHCLLPITTGPPSHTPIEPLPHPHSARASSPPSAGCMSPSPLQPTPTHVPLLHPHPIYPCPPPPQCVTPSLGRPCLNHPQPALHPPTPTLN